MLWAQKIFLPHLPRYCTALTLCYMWKDISITTLCSVGPSLTRTYEATKPLKWEP